MRRAIIAVALVAILCAPARSDEGMWLFNHPPVKWLKQKYNFEPTPEWLEHLQKSSVRFNNGGSGSFVSAGGLVMTNQHVGADCMQKLSTKEKDYVNNGFRAAVPAGERKCPDLELNLLVEIEDVTDRVNAAVRPGMDAAAAEKARRAVMNAIEKESFDKSGLRSDVVALYRGSEYHLYRYKKYTDIRLVFAPEKAIAYFGGDPDNFEYPRYDLDISFFRVYENDKPSHIDHYLKWSDAGAQENELVFVSGHPGGTERLDTVAHLEFFRDRLYPLYLNRLRRREVLLLSYSARSSESARRAGDRLLSIQNSRKAYSGMLAGLQDPQIMNRKRDGEKALREAVMKDPRLKKSYGDAWNEVAASIRPWDAIYTDLYLLEKNGISSDLFLIARNLVRLAEETAKPNAERLREYSEGALESLKLELFSDAPIYDDLETVRLADSLSMMAEMKGMNNDLVQRALAGQSPRERAAALVDGTRLQDVAVRKKLADGGLRAIEASRDPMIQFARLIDPAARKVRRAHEEQVEEAQRQAYAKIAQAKFAVYGSDQYPDATFTLRLSFGEVKGYKEEGRSIPWATTLGGAYQHAAEHDNKEPFALPKSWIERKSRLKVDTPFNFVNTADIIGGNSGSPVVNRSNELVGIIFDGNIESLVLDFIYTDEQARALAVHSAGIMEALRKIYGADALVAELTAGR